MYAIRFVNGCRINVNVTRMMILKRSMGKNGYVMINAKMRKPIWSSMGALDPGLRLRRRLMKEPNRSPMCVPTDNNSALYVAVKRFFSNLIKYRKGPVKMPKNSPDSNPLIVLWSPNILFPSINLLPRSMGFPPPKTVGVAFEMYAGRM